ACILGMRPALSAQRPRGIFRMRHIALGLIALACATAAHAQPQQAPPPVTELSAEQLRTVDRLRNAALESDLAYDLVEDLVTSVGPRLAASENEARARDWAAEMLRRQRFSNVRIEPFTMPYWDAAREEGWIVSP